MCASAAGPCYGLQRDLATGEGLGSFAVSANAPAIEVERTRADIVARRAEQMAKRAGLEQQIAGKQAEQEENVATLDKLAASLPWLEQKAELRRQLLNIEFGNRLAYLDAQQALVEGRSALAVQQRRGPEIAAALGALVRQREQTAAEYAHGVLKDLAEAEQKEGELVQQLAQAAHKAAQTVLTAPIGGTVQQLAVHTVGGVVTPAQALLTVVPDDARVLVEATVDNKDIGFVHAGQEVELKVQTFEFTRYGLLHGHVLDVSHDRVEGQSSGERKRADKASDQGADDARPNESGYVAHVALNSARMMVDGGEQMIAPGMAVTAEIKTGRRSVISYLLSPLQRYAHEGVRER